jgi:cytochrome c oxidase subunit IV
MSDPAPGANPYKIYYQTWFLLLVITVAMLVAEKFHFPRVFLVLFLLLFMAVKAAMIAGNFMHLRFEKKNMAVMVASGIVLTSLILYVFITPESMHIKRKTTYPAQAPAATAGHPSPAPAH